MLRRLPITLIAPLIVSVPVLAIGLLLSMMWNGQSRSAVTELADRNIDQVHALASNKVADVLSIPVRVCRVDAHLVQTGALDPDDLHAWRDTLINQAFAFDMLSSIVWGGADGRTAWISRYADGNYYWAVKDDPSSPTMLEWRLNDDRSVPDEPTNSFDFDLFARPWFITPRDAREPTWSEPFVWVGGEGQLTLGLSYGIPLYENDQLLGVIDADFSLNDLSGFLSSIEIGKSGVAVIVGPDGRLIAASNDTPILTADGERVDTSASPDPLISAVSGRIRDIDSVHDGHNEITVDGEVYYLRSSPVGREVGLRWTLATIIPERDFLAEIDAGFHRSSLVGLLAVVLAIVVGLLAARWLVSPLVTLVTAVRRIGQGDLDTEVSIRHAPEYEKLAHEINEMALGLQDRMRMRESLSLAMEVQKNLLPEQDPSIAGLDIAGHSTYCDETGGDYYDFLDVSDVDDDTAVVALGDVMGHGVAAAMLMATARGILRSRCAVPGSLADLLEHLNNMLVPDTRGTRFMTMLLVTICPNRHEVRWASAGHGPPLIYDANTDSFKELDGGGMPLGIVDSEDYQEETESDIGPGHVMLISTDGLWEAKGQQGGMFGMERVEALIRDNAKRPAKEISQRIRDSLARFRGELDPDDDLTFIVIKVL